MNEKEVKSDEFRNTIQEFEKIFGNMSCKQIYELGQCLFNNYIPKSLVEEKIDKLKEEIETLKRDFEIVDHECSRLEQEDIKKDMIINLMAEQLTTPVHSKEWVIDYYKKEGEKVVC